ncbi:MAG: universal stress protein [Nitrospiraceae bacterium]|nr:universal stress protein [Nitrospiraceae bacterium]
MFTKILIPTDGSKTATKAAEAGIELAKRLGASVVALSVADTRLHISQTVPAAAAAGRVKEPIEDYLREAAGDCVDAVRKECEKASVKVKAVVAKGHPVNEIIKAAERSKADLIVIGSHGRSALAAAVLGSVTYGVINGDTKVPVLVIRK